MSGYLSSIWTIQLPYPDQIAMYQILADLENIIRREVARQILDIRGASLSNEIIIVVTEIRMVETYSYGLKQMIITIRLKEPI